MVSIQETYQSLYLNGGKEAAEAFRLRLEQETGVKIAFTLPGRVRKRKHGWHRATGRVVALRLPESVYAILARRAQLKGVPVGQYLRDRIAYDLTRDHHHKRSGSGEH